MKIPSNTAFDYLEKNFKYKVKIYIDGIATSSKSPQVKWCKENFGCESLAHIYEHNDKESFYKIIEDSVWDYFWNYNDCKYVFFFKNESDALLFKLICG